MGDRTFARLPHTFASTPKDPAFEIIGPLLPSEFFLESDLFINWNLGSILLP